MYHLVIYFIKKHGWVSKQVLAEHYQDAEYWLYPCIFEETFCLTALEAAISKTVVITNGLAALSETAKYGFTIPGNNLKSSISNNPLTESWQEECLSSLFKIIKIRSTQLLLFKETIEDLYENFFTNEIKETWVHIKLFAKYGYDHNGINDTTRRVRGIIKIALIN